MSTYKEQDKDNGKKIRAEIIGAEIIRRALKDMPGSPGVYRMLDAQGEVLYVGKAKHLKNRVGNYANIRQLTNRIQRMVHATRMVEITLTASEMEALLLEANMIKRLRPRYNILLKDGKTYPYIRISNDHPYPRIFKYRGPKQEKQDYFGPFVSAGAVNETITLLQKAFLLRPCSDNVFKNRSRPCLQYQIKRCSAPCVNAISSEDYASLLRQAKHAMSGKSEEIKNAMLAEMEQASKAMDYERAAQLRDRVRALTYIQEHMHAGASRMTDADVFALAREKNAVCVQLFCFRGGSNFGNLSFYPVHTEDQGDGEILSAFIAQYYQDHEPPPEVLVSTALPEVKLLSQALAHLAGRKVEILLPQRGGKRDVMAQALKNAGSALTRRLNENMRETGLLEAVGELFGLEEPPVRIEVYDNSHISGSNAVGAMIAAGPEGFMKNAYRQFNIKSADIVPGDDYAMMREVLTRRFKRLLAEQERGESASMPSLVLIDGGAGQLSTASAVLEELGVGGVPLVAVSKGRERNAGREWFHQAGKEAFQLPENDPVLHYLQRLRDEAHRFAIGTHRNRRSKSAKISELDAISSIGPARKKALLRHFGSARGVGGASLAEIERVPGINRELARRIYNHFHSA